MTPIELISSFVPQKLEGDITRLACFPLGNLRNDEEYGCPGRNFDSDDTELMQPMGYTRANAFKGRHEFTQ